MTTLATTTPESAPNPRATKRRGTVLLFALGVLAVISVAALSYVTFVRVDRNASAAVAKTVGYEGQVKRVQDEIAGVIAADLWGGKLVTNDVPSDPNPPESANPIWPKMFEDGEFRDYPFENFATFNTDLPGKKGKGVVDNSTLGINEVAPPDDAWLAQFDPLWYKPGTGNTDRTHWRQISNIRSVYKYDNGGTPNRFNDDRWIRGDGKYVDLGQPFLDYRSVGTEKYGNPGTNLLDKSIFGTNSPNGAVLPRQAAGDFTLSPYRVMNFGDGTSDPVFQPSDERFFADTDGDLRADARWQVIDSLGNLEGLMWVAAIRIVDLSAVVNINSAIEGGYGSTNAEDYAEGRTPADVDLYRLLLQDPQELSNLNILSRQVDWGAWTQHADPSPFRLIGASEADGGTFADHLMDRLRVADLTHELTNPYPTVTTVPAFDLTTVSNWVWRPDISNQRLAFTQRLAIWQNVGSAPGRGPVIDSPRGPIQPGYDNNTMIDLHAFDGSNNRSILTKWEQTIDGPDDADGFLPRPEDAPSDPVGPLRSRERPGDARSPASNIYGDGARPSGQQVRGDVRRLLTTVSGVSDLSPVPVLNEKAKTWNGVRPYYARAFNTKVPLWDFDTAASALSHTPEVFQSFVWALAPLATDEYITAMNHQRAGALIGDNIKGDFLGLAASYHYGGSDYATGPSPASGLGLTAGLASVEYPLNPGPGASFAMVTAGALTMNLADASDPDDEPSVARMFVAQQGETPVTSRVVSSRAILGSRFSQGDIPEVLLPINALGQRVTNVTGFEQAADTGDQPGIDAWLQTAGNQGLTVVGLERQPYITEVFGFVLFENTGGASDQVTVTDTTNQVGAVIAVQLANPYSSNLTIGSEYEITILQPGIDDMSGTLNNAPLRLVVPPGVLITRNDPVTLVYTYYDKSKGTDFSPVLGINADDPGGTVISGNAAAVDRLIANTPGVNANAEKLVLAPESKDLVEMNPAFLVKFANAPLRAALRRTVPALATPGLSVPPLAVVDYMESASDFFPTSNFDITGSVNLRTFFDAMYFTTLGYSFGPSVDEQREFNKLLANGINGRIGFTSSIKRPVKRSTFGGFPAYIAATRPTDLDQISSSDLGKQFGHAWLVPVDAASTAKPASVTPSGILPDTMLVLPAAGTGLHDGAELADMHEFENTLPLTKSADTKSGGIPDRPIGGGWQLFIPNRPLNYVSELHQLSVYANLCKDNQLSNIAAWTTVGQQLRDSLSWDFKKSSNAFDNPYAGVLDPTRFVPNEETAVLTEGKFLRDESLNLPLALRVFDCFEALRYPDALAQGRININTAPERVLQMLPMMAPGDSTIGLNPTNDRVELMLRYRDAWDPGDSNVYPSAGVDYSQLNSGMILTLGTGTFNDFSLADKIRRNDLSHDPTLSGPNVQYPFTTGFATAGELAFLDAWDLSGEVNGFAFEPGFVSPLATNGVDDGAGNDTNNRLFEGEVGPTAEFDNVADDPEERLALFRAVSNIVSSRSDVFGAWFILRGYDPKVIEAIPVKDTTDPTIAMNQSDIPFKPAYESRWFVIFDRSNCRIPTDRPRVLLKVQLPSTEP